MKRTLLAAVGLALVVAGLALILREGPSDRGQAATPTPPTHQPLLTAQEAISRSLLLIPEDRTPTATTSKLINYTILDDWTDDPRPRADSAAPVWLVGFTVDGLTVADGNPIIGMNPTVAALWTDPAEGIYFAWDANSGALMLQAALVGSDPDNYSSLLALPTVTATIVPATVISVIETSSTGTPEP